MKLKHIIGYGATAVVALTIGIAAGGSGDTAAPAAASQPKPTTSTVTSTSVSTVTQKVPGPTKFVTITGAPQLAADVEEGTWDVGVDIKPGKYKVTEAVSGDCYWKISTTGKDDIIANDIVTGGKPTVTLKKGQTFSTQDCGSWGKVG